jgi:outer membrane protein assembly factor BamB
VASETSGLEGSAMHVLRFVAFLGAIGVPSVIGWAEDQGDQLACWPQFRGKESQGIAPKPLHLPATFGKNRCIIWKTTLPGGHSSPCIWDDRIYVTGFVKESKDLQTIFLDRITGNILWRRSAPTTTIERLHELNSPASSTPACDSERVYVYFGSYGLLCYSKDGELKWQRPLPPIPSPFGSGTSPVVAGERVLLNSGTAKFFSLLALDRRTGQTVWQKDRARGTATGLWSTPIVRHTANGDEVIVAGGGEVAAYRLQDGTPRWHVGGLPAISLSTPILGDGMLFITLTNPIGDLDENIVKLPPVDEIFKKYDKNHDGKLTADELPDDLILFTRGRADKIGDWAKVRELIPYFDKNKDKALDRQEWEAMLQQMSKSIADLGIVVAAIRLEGKADPHQPEVAWTVSKAVPEVPSPLYHQGRVYLISERGMVTCRNARSGKEIYRERLGARGACYSSPVLGDNKIYEATDGGVVVVLKPGDRFEVVAKNDFGEAIFATLALMDNKIYLRTERHLYAIGE